MDPEMEALLNPDKVQWVVDVNARQIRSQTPLNDARAYGHTELSRYPLDTDTFANLGASPYISSVTIVQHHETDVAGRPVQWCVGVNARNGRSETALNQCRYGHTEVSQYPLDEDTSANVESSPFISSARRVQHHTMDGADRPIQWGVDINARNGRSETALNPACAYGHTEVSQYLLDEDTSADLGESPFISSVTIVQHHETDVAGRPVQWCVDVNARNVRSEPALNQCRYGHTEVSQYPLDEDTSANVEASPFISSARRVQQHTTDGDGRPIQWGVDVNARTVGSETAVNPACAYGHAEVARYTPDEDISASLGESSFISSARRVQHHETDAAEELVQRDVDVNAGDICSETALNQWTYIHETRVAQYPLDKDPAANLGESSVISSLTKVQHHKMVDALSYERNHFDENLLEFSPGYRDVLYAKFIRFRNYSMKGLLECHTNVRDNYGKTVLHYLLESYFPTSFADNRRVFRLLDKGADVNAASKSGETPFYIACSNGLEGIVAKMLECEAKVNGKCIKKRPLNAACKNNHMSVVLLLLTNGANPNILEKYDNTFTSPLCVAIVDGNTKLVGMLLEHGADPNVPADVPAVTSSSTSRLPLFVAVDIGANCDIVTLLLNAGADVNATSHDGESVLRFVAERMARYRYKYRRRAAKVLMLLLEHGAPLPSPSMTISPLTTLLEVKQEFIVHLFRAGATFNLMAKFNKLTGGYRWPWRIESIHLCQAAVLAGYRPSSQDLQDLQGRQVYDDSKDRLVNWLKEDSEQAPSLLRQCRVAIRRRLSAVAHRSILPAIDKLPLPKDIKLYLQFDGRLTEIDLSVYRQDAENWLYTTEDEIYWL